MNYRYFLRKFGDYYSEIYRIPSNGKNIIDNIPLLEKCISNDKWSNNLKDISTLQFIFVYYLAEKTNDNPRRIAFCEFRFIRVRAINDELVSIVNGKMVLKAA